MKKNDPASAPASPNALDRGVRGKITGVTRIGPRALGIGAVVAGSAVALIVAGAHHQNGPRPADAAQIAYVAPAATDTGHFGADVPIVATPAPSATPVRRGPAVPEGLVLPADAATHAPAPSGAQAPSVPDVAGAGAAPPAAAAPVVAPTQDPVAVERAARRTAALQAALAAQQARRDAQRMAYEAPVIVGGTAAGAAAPAQPAGAPPVQAASASDAAQAAPGTPGVAATTAQTASVPNGASASGSATAQANPNAFLSGPFNQYAAKPGALQQSGTANAADYLDASRYAARSKYEIVASSVIPAALVTGIDSEQPGLISAQVRQDVYDSKTGRYLLIPKGSRLIGVYKNDVADGQTRVLVAWERLIFPDTSSIDLHALAGADTEGYAGLGGKVDNHFGSTLLAAVLSSVISAGLQLSQPQMSMVGTVNGVTVAAPSAGSTIAGSIGQNVAQLGSAAVQKSMSLPPVIHVPRGYPFLVIVDRDMVLPGPYREGQ